MSRVVGRGLTRWIEDGIALTIELSTQGPLVVGGNQTLLPFIAGGPSNAPLNWTWKSGPPAGNVTTDTALNRWSVSGSASTVASSQFIIYSPKITPTVGHSVRASVKFRTMDTKVATLGSIQLQAWNNGVFVRMLAEVLVSVSATDWQPLVVTSPTYPAGADYNQIVIQLFIATNNAALTTFGAQFSDCVWFDDAAYVPIDYGWRDVTCDASSIATRYGRETFTQRYDVGSCQLTVRNDDGEFSYQNPHPLNLRPGRLLRAKATYKGVDYPLFYGVIDQLQDGYSMDGHAVTTITAYDVQTLFASLATPTLGTPINWTIPFLSGLRINTLLDAVGWGARSIDAGQFVQQSIQASGRAIRDELGVSADSEGGSVFADRTGLMVYKDRTWLTTDPNLKEVTADITARPDTEDYLPTVDNIPNQTGSPIICPNQLNTVWALDRIINHVELANAGQSMQTFDDKASQADYGIHSYQRLDYVNSQSSTLATRAADLMASFKDAKVRVNSVGYKPARSPQGWPFTLNVFLNWLVRVWYANTLTKWGYAIVTHVQSVSHRITPTDWETMLSLDQPISYADAPIRDYRPAYWHTTGIWQQSQWATSRFNLAQFDRSSFV